jgi:ComF family protein
VLRLKFGGDRTVVAALGSAMAAIARTGIEGSIADVVTWVPLSRARLGERGFDQAALLARRVARMVGLDDVPLLERRVDLSPQAKRGGNERREAMKGAFAPLGDAPERVLLVDDVLTTGATAAACASALERVGARSVTLLAAARSGRLPTDPKASSPYTREVFRSGSVVARGRSPRKSMPAAGEATHVRRPLVAEHGAV